MQHGTLEASDWLAHNCGLTLAAMFKPHAMRLNARNLIQVLSTGVTPCCYACMLFDDSIAGRGAVAPGWTWLHTLMTRSLISGEPLLLFASLCKLYSK